MPDIDAARREPLRSYSGEHEFQWDHLRDAIFAGTEGGTDDDRELRADEHADDLWDLMLQEQCPRCDGPLLGASMLSEHVYPLPAETAIREDIARHEREHPSNPDATIYPAGSRVTECRCIPICAVCGDHEGIGVTVPPSVWPVDRELVIEQLRSRYEGMTVGGGER